MQIVLNNEHFARLSLNDVWLHLSFSRGCVDNRNPLIVLVSWPDIRAQCLFDAYKAEFIASFASSESAIEVR